MSTSQLDRLRAACHRLRLYQIEAELGTVLEQAAKRDVSYADFLDDVLGREVGAKTQKHLAMRLAMARFPFQKTLESFDFEFQPSIDPKLIRELAAERYMPLSQRQPASAAPLAHGTAGSPVRHDHSRGITL